MTMKVIPVPVRSDNYAYLLVDEKSKQAAAIDPYDVRKVVSSAQGLGVEIVACITTHHHDDHCGGNHVCDWLIYFRVLFSVRFSDTVSSPASCS
jgi:glyoxylase-like metal-dependent hydrolase (beta-lactamase superfamily II)